MKIELNSQNTFTLGQLVGIVEEALKNGCDSSSHVYFSMGGKWSMIVERQEFENSPIAENWYDELNPDDLKKEYREVFHDMKSSVEMMGYNSSLEVDFSHKSVNFIINDVTAI